MKVLSFIWFCDTFLLLESSGTVKEGISNDTNTEQHRQRHKSRWTITHTDAQSEELTLSSRHHTIHNQRWPAWTGMKRIQWKQARRQKENAYQQAVTLQNCPLDRPWQPAHTLQPLHSIHKAASSDVDTLPSPNSWQVSRLSSFWCSYWILPLHLTEGCCRLCAPHLAASSTCDCMFLTPTWVLLSS